MWEKEREELLQDYRYRRNILQEITLDDIEKWDNVEPDWIGTKAEFDALENKKEGIYHITDDNVNIKFSDIEGKPSTLAGYGILDADTKNEANEKYYVGDFKNGEIYRGKIANVIEVYRPYKSESHVINDTDHYLEITKYSFETPIELPVWNDNGTYKPYNIVIDYDIWHNNSNIVNYLFKFRIPNIYRLSEGDEFTVFKKNSDGTIPVTGYKIEVPKTFITIQNSRSLYFSLADGPHQMISYDDVKRLRKISDGYSSIEAINKLQSCVVCATPLTDLKTSPSSSDYYVNNWLDIRRNIGSGSLSGYVSPLAVIDGVLNFIAPTEGCYRYTGRCGIAASGNVPVQATIGSGYLINILTTTYNGGETLPFSAPLMYLTEGQQIPIVPIKWDNINRTYLTIEYLGTK